MHQITRYALNQKVEGMRKREPYRNTKLLYTSLGGAERTSASELQNNK
jgi:hypothetical protein